VGGRLRIVGRSEVFEYRDTTWSKVGDLEINRIGHNVQTLRPLMQPCLSDYKFLQPVTARLSSTLPGYAASKCIDGDEISVTHGTSLCHSSGASAPWLAVDYVASVSIRWVEIFNRRDCCGDRTKNVNVRVSDDLPTTDKQMFSGGALLGHFAGPGTDGQHIVISGGPLFGRYVIFQMNNSDAIASLNLAEVKAFGNVGTKVSRRMERWNASTTRVTWVEQAIASLGLLQLPAMFLAIFGLVKSASEAEGRCWAVLKCLLILITPFFLLDFLQHCLLVFLAQQAMSKSLAKANIVWFLGNTDKRRTLGLDMARVFCGTVFQLVLQLVLVFGFTPWASVRTSQLCSIGSSMFGVIKTATEVLMFKEEEEEQREGRTVRQVLVDFFRTKLDLLANVFRLLPLLLTNAVFNIGTLSLLIAVAGGPAIAILVISLVFDLVVVFTLPSFDSVVDKLGLYHDLKLPSMSSAIYISWTNFFVLTGQPERRSSTFFCLLGRFFFNMVTLLIIVVSTDETDFKTIGVISIFLAGCGVVFLSLLCNSEWMPKKPANANEGDSG